MHNRKCRRAGTGTEVLGTESGGRRQVKGCGAGERGSGIFVEDARCVLDFGGYEESLEG